MDKKARDWKQTAWEHQAPALMDWTLTQLSGQETSELPPRLQAMSSTNNQRWLMRDAISVRMIIGCFIHALQRRKQCTFPQEEREDTPYPH